MQLSLEKLRSLNESDLRRKVLVPLFRDMGFRDVKETHGSGELGKDIVMWKEDHFRGRENYAVVAKAQKITTGSQSSTVCRQVRESLGSSYTDPISLVQLDVHRVLVVTSRECTREARDSIRSDLKASGLEGKVDLLDGEKLFEMIRKYLPTTVLWDPLEKASKALREASDNWDFTLQVGPDGASSLFVSDRHRESQVREPIRGSATLRFPPTPEGMRKRAEYQKFLETGTPVELSAENIEAFEMPEFIRSLAAEGEITTLFFGPSQLDEVAIRSLIVLGQNDEVLYAFDYIHFTHRQSGSKEFSLDNRGQAIPFRVRLVFDKESGLNTFNLRFESAGANVLQYLRWLTLQKAIAAGHRVVLADWNTGLPELGVDASSLGLNAPSSQLLELAKRLVFIQNRTRVEISLNNEHVFALEDVANILFASQVLAHGQAPLPTDRCSFSVADASEIEGKLGERVAIPAHEACFSVNILGSTIQLGEAHILFRGVLGKLDASSTHQYYIDAVEGEPFIAAFPGWSSPGEPGPASASEADGPEEQGLRGEPAS